LAELKEAKAISHITYAEIYGREKGIRESLREVLVAKFPQERPALAAEFESERNVERLKSLIRAAGLAQSPDDFRSRASSGS
jgi:hypothetical protein